jgi:ADP-heptose:LPS heptosyltransferase
MGLGDELMATAEARRLQERGDLRPVAFRGKDGRPRWHPIFDNNPRIARTFLGAQVSDNRSGNRPYIASFDKRRFVWVAKFKCRPGEIYFAEIEKAFGQAHAGRLVIEPHVKQRDGSNKAWPWHRWQAVVDARPDLPWLQLGPPGTQILRGVMRATTLDFRLATAVLAYSMGYVGTEGGLHHAAAAVGKPAVVLFSEFISPAQTGYATHHNIYRAGEPCGMRSPCRSCAESMNKISVADVLAGIRQTFEKEIAA